MTCCLTESVCHSPVKSHVAQRRWIDGTEDNTIPKFLDLQYEQFFMSVHCQLFHSCLS